MLSGGEPTLGCRPAPWLEVRRDKRLALVMTRTRLTPFLLAVPMAMSAGLAPASAGAADYCVAPNTGCGGTPVPNLEQALDLADNATDPDRVFLGAATYMAPTATGFYYSESSSPVEIIGQDEAQRSSRPRRRPPSCCGSSAEPAPPRATHDRAAPDRGGRAQGALDVGSRPADRGDRGSDAGEQAPRRRAPERRHARGIERRAWERPGHDRGPPRAAAARCGARR